MKQKDLWLLSKGGDSWNRCFGLPVFEAPVAVAQILGGLLYAPWLAAYQTSIHIN